MAKHKSSDIRNIAICGHAGSGKTMLTEAMLLKAGVINRLGSVRDGSTVSDFDQEEKTRQCSLSSSVMHCDYAGKRFNIIDTPGSMDFIGGAIGGIAGADLAVICVNAVRGVETMTRKSWEYAGKLGLARMIAICRMDNDNVNYQEVLAGVQKVFGSRCVPFSLPEGEGLELKGIASVMAEGVSGEEAEAMRMQIVESAVESDDALMEKYLETGEVAADQVPVLMQKAVATGSLVPVLCVASEKDLGVADLLTGIATWGPSPFCLKRAALEGEGEAAKETELQPAEGGPLCGLVFKVVSDPHVGKVSYIRVFSGKLESKSQAFVTSTGKQEKIGQLQEVQGDKRADVPEAAAGDVVGVTKVDALHVGDTIFGNGCKLRLAPLPFPRPMAGLAVAPKTRGDEQKMSTNLARLCDEDPTFLFERNEYTGEQVVRGVGQLHLDVTLHRMKTRYGVEVDTRPQRIPYLETIAQESEGSYRHKKQTGGSGQFGEVHLRVKPNERGKGFEFVDAIVGGVISGPFIPSVEKGVRAALEHGPIAGYPVVDVIVELFFGKEHPVDSKDIAFQLAGRYCFGEVVAKCRPVLLEPIVNLEIVFPAQYFGDISGDISTRRGRPTGTDQLGDMQVLKVQAPLAEVADYGSALNAITQGEGFFTMDMSHYEVVPSNIAQQVAARAKAAREAEEK